MGGFAISLIGRQLTIVAAPIQVFQLTESTLAVGLLGLVQFPALLAGSVVGGTLSDAFDRRTIMLGSQVILGVTAVGLALNTVAWNTSLTAVYALTAVMAFMSGIDSPSRSAAIPRLLGDKLLAPAYALQTLLFASAAAIGPAFGGILIGRLGVASAYWIDAATFGVALVAVALMRPMPQLDGGTKAGMRSIVEGIRHIRANQVIKGVFIIDITAMVLGSPRALFPEFGTVILGGDEATVGYLFAAPGIGAALAGLTSGWVTRVQRGGVATMVAVMVWGMGIVVFGLAGSVPVALLGLVVAGAGDSISAVFRGTMLQLSTPDRLRGRLSAVQIAVVAGGPRVGDAEAGVVATAFGPRAAAWSGGLGAMVGAVVVTRMLPAFRQWRLSDRET